jgi:hypothetical protein
LMMTSTPSDIAPQAKAGERAAAATARPKRENEVRKGKGETHLSFPFRPSPFAFSYEAP